MPEPRRNEAEEFVKVIAFSSALAPSFTFLSALAPAIIIVLPAIWAISLILDLYTTHRFYKPNPAQFRSLERNRVFSLLVEKIGFPSASVAFTALVEFPFVMLLAFVLMPPVYTFISGFSAEPSACLSSAFGMTGVTHLHAALRNLKKERKSHRRAIVMKVDAWIGRKALSPLLATILLIVIVLAGGLVVYSLISGLFSRIGTAHSVELMNVDLLKTSIDGMISITLKNTGSATLDFFVVSINTDAGEVKGPKVRVLDIYPVQPYAQTVVNNDGLSLFYVTTITLADFNGGGYDLSQYDVVILDVQDGGYNLDSEEQNAIKNYVSQGGSLIATHDTVTYVGRNPILWEVLGIDNNQPTWFSMDKASRTREGTVTTYPHTLPSSFNVLWTHTTNQHILNAVRWFEATADNSGDDFYLTTNFYGRGKAVMIQWGHTATAPAAGSGESKAIVNALFWAGTKKAEPGQTVSMTLTGFSITAGLKYPVTITAYWADGSVTTKTITMTCSS